MRIILSVGNVVMITLIGYVGLIGFLHLLKFGAGKSVPVISPLAKGGVQAWESAAA